MARRGSGRGVRRVLVLLLILAVGGGYYYYVKKHPKPAPAPQGKEARILEDTEPGVTGEEEISGPPTSAPEPAVNYADAQRAESLARANAMYEQCCKDKPDKSKWGEIQRLYSVGLDACRDEAARKEVLGRLAKLTKETVLNPEYACEGALCYTVADTDKGGLSGIAKRINGSPEFKGTPYAVHYDGLAALNGIDRKAPILHPGQKLKYFKAIPIVVIDKSKFRLTLYLGPERFIREYRIAIGKENKTPVGEFVIETKTSDPVWHRPGKLIQPDDPKNPLGSRWLGFSKGQPGAGLGIHGTREPSSIGKEVSEGCIRLLNEDVEELYGFAVTGTRVIIRE